MSTVRVLIYTEADADDLSELMLTPDLENALNARLDEVFTPNGPIALRVLGVEVEEDD